MITQFFMNIIFGLVSGMLELLPDVSWSVTTSTFQSFLDIVRVASYMFPFDTLFMIIGLIIDFTLIRIAISIPKTIWDLLPFA